MILVRNARKTEIWLNSLVSFRSFHSDVNNPGIIRIIIEQRPERWCGAQYGPRVWCQERNSQQSKLHLQTPGKRQPGLPETKKPPAVRRLLPVAARQCFVRTPAHRKNPFSRYAGQLLMQTSKHARQITARALRFLAVHTSLLHAHGPGSCPYGG